PDLLFTRCCLVVVRLSIFHPVADHVPDVSYHPGGFLHIYGDRVRCIFQHLFQHAAHPCDILRDTDTFQQGISQDTETFCEDIRRLYLTFCHTACTQHTRLPAHHDQTAGDFPDTARYFSVTVHRCAGLYVPEVYEGHGVEA